MRSRSYCNRVPQQRRISRLIPAVLVAIVAYALAGALPAVASGDAPQWMHALTGVPLSSYDENTDAVVLYSETSVTVLSSDKIRTRVRRAYKILRPNGREHGTVYVDFNPTRKITSLHGWCIPAQGKDYEVKDKDAMDVSLPNIEGSELVSDVRARILRIPAPDPGNIVGYEYELEEQPMVLEDEWGFQRLDPVRENHYSLQLPSGWEFKSSWLNHAEVKPDQVGNNQWQWTVRDIKPIRKEYEMPPLEGVAERMFVNFFPPGGPGTRGFSNWQEMGNWYRSLINGRQDSSQGIKQEVATLTASATTNLQKIQAIARFLQRDVRYVAIELGIGGWQPHPAAQVSSNRYGDCKDKATLMSAMLREIGVESYYVLINSERGVTTRVSPAHISSFDHVIIAIKLPEATTDPSLIATMQHPQLGKLLFFDPTNPLTPFGQIGGYLQANYGLLVTPNGGELVELPQQPTSMNSIQRAGKLALDATGTLKGDIEEQRLGDRAAAERARLQTVNRDTDRIKPIENLLASSLSNFRITRASVLNLQQTDQPFGFNYSFESPNYAKHAGDLLLLRPRVLGTKSSSLLETREPRQFPIEFDGPVRDTDDFEITIPTGYTVDDLPAPVNADYDFASYHSKTEASGNLIRYTRTFEIKKLSVPAGRAEELRKFYRIIAGDERNTVVLKSNAK
jgi:hypothetical protein